MPKVTWLRHGGGGAGTRLFSHSHDRVITNVAQSHSEMPACSPCWWCLRLQRQMVMGIDGDRFRRESTPVTVTLGFFGKGIKGSALGGQDFLPVGLVQRSLKQWVSAFGGPASIHPNCIQTLGDPSNFPPHTRLRNGHQTQSPAQVRAGALRTRFG